MTKTRRADSILQALLSHRTVREAAAAAKVTERTVYEYLSDPAFSARYQAARDDIIRGAANALRAHLSEAVDTIAAAMVDPKARPQDRLAAAKTIIDYAAKFTDTQDLLERVSALENNMNRETPGFR
jgi:predicted DNA-binding transcriptional regulator YafY